MIRAALGVRERAQREAARARLNAARRLRGRGETIAALVLFREGAHLLARAAVTNDQSPHDAADPTALAAKLIELLEGAARTRLLTSDG